MREADGVGHHAAKDQSVGEAAESSVRDGSSDGKDGAVVGPFNLDRRRGLRAAIRAHAVRNEIITFTSNEQGLEAAANMALQLQRLKLYHHLVLADQRRTCTVGQRRWHWLGCGFSGGLPGFETKYAAGVGGGTAKLWSLWSAKWLLVARLVELRVNVLALDTDMLIQTDPYPLLRSPPIDRFHMVIVPEGSRVNLGFIYVRGERCAPSGGVASTLWDVVRRLRLFTEDWPLLDRKGRGTSTYGLWDQGLFTDAIISAFLREHVYPYTYLQSSKTGVWREIHWPPANATVAQLAAQHSIQWRDVGVRRRHPDDARAWEAEARSYRIPSSATRPRAFLPPRRHAQHDEWSQRNKHGGFPLLWLPLRPLDPLAHLRRQNFSAVTPGWLSGGASAVSSAMAAGGAGRTELMLATPDWLYCLVGRWAITAGWPSLAPRSVCAVLHLVECRSQFGSFSAFKSTRPYVQRALGYWHLADTLPAHGAVRAAQRVGGDGALGVAPAAPRRAAPPGALRGDHQPRPRHPKHPMLVQVAQPQPVWPLGRCGRLRDTGGRARRRRRRQRL